ncbi:transcription termination/antitermination protein NusG [endosymbiont of Sipalinus gigas]|uniref:transcription termination/antitermination protein NusG n=1 Tax=endosymbiont of Sipalinus gigas TaxID=1972134 RepID=UPI000DC70CEC|nr:transcription termination/antitermination protein NusG [endosymbiont of Sipalinus gigas]BBA85276.1 transcription termination/antitermination protein NusG [endosymbiont of Sipalinus gigas]
MEKKWYIIQVFSGFELNIVNNIKEKIKLENMEYLFGKTLIPKEEVIEFIDGNKKKSERKFFPGYIFIEMNVNEISLNLIKKIPNVIGFMGKNKYNCPIPLNSSEILSLINKINNNKGKFIPKITFDIGEKIRVNDGPFSDFIGIIESIDYTKNTLIVLISIFGRNTPVQLNFSKVEKY